MKARRILLLTLSFGSGHVRAAHTIAAELKRQDPDVEVLVLDALASCRFLFRAGYVWPYWAMVRYAPALWARFFARRLTRKHERTGPDWAFRRGCAAVFKTIVEFKPETIVATEVAACEIAALAKRDGLSTARLISVITDYEAEPVWIKSEVDTYTVPDEYVRDQLVAWGAARERVVLTGIPADRGFVVQQDIRETLTRYNLTDAARTVLIMGGGMGPTRMDQVVARLLELAQPVQIVVIAGHDERMRRRLSRLRPSPQIPLRVIGWTDDIAALMQVASVLITKPGGVTTTEAILRGLPLVFFDVIPGPEQRNAARIVEAGAGLMSNSHHDAALAALALLRDEHTRKRMSAMAQLLAQPDATATIAQLALGDEIPAQTLVRTTA
jgi:processive 1,2-diacylglycerol beta-glucosyltransferase